jgi:phosphoribosyl-AMP cyclohydrolase
MRDTRYAMRERREATMNEEIKFDANGLVPAIAQDARTKQVLMFAYMNADALRVTMETGYATFWSRRRERLWRKGETSGNVLRVRELLYDCDGDALLLLCDPAGPTCHTGEVSCFYRALSLPKSAETED